MIIRKLTPLCLGCFASILLLSLTTSQFAMAQEKDMDSLWGDQAIKMRADGVKSVELFDVGNYAMFIHWGLYSQVANKVDGKTYYGIGEWIMNPRMAGIPRDKYKGLAKTFNPVKFNAKEIVALAKDAGMKNIVITSKHHDGFAMYDSDACDFNVVDATPWSTDPMKDLATACAEAGLGFGFYYSHNQDWTFPGGGGGPDKDENGDAADFDDYFKKKCLPQIEEITTKYGPISIVWFDTPGKMPKEYVQQLVDLVHKNQPNALVSGRAGHNLGDYQTLGDMEVPVANVEGLWESVDTTNDSWAYAWYDQYWKSPKEILHRLVSCVGRGGTYMLNIGPRGDGSVPERAAKSLRGAGKWIAKYPQVVYGTDPSPWGHSLAWGDVTTKGDKMFLTVFEWPASGKLYLPGLQTEIKSAQLLGGEAPVSVSHSKANGWTILELPGRAPEKLASVVEVTLAGPAKVESAYGIDPEISTEISATFADATGVNKEDKRWMEKFGEWKRVVQFDQWNAEGKATWTIEIAEPGEYNVDLKYRGEGRVVWGVAVQGGEKIQNQQNSSHNYQAFPIGWVNFPKAGQYKIDVTCVEGNFEAASLTAINFTPVK